MQILNATLENVPKDRTGKLPKEYLRVALDVVAPSAGLPPIGAVEEVCCYLTANTHLQSPNSVEIYLNQNLLCINIKISHVY